MNGKELLAPQAEIYSAGDGKTGTNVSVSGETALAMLRRNVDEQKKRLSVLIDERKLQSTGKLSEALESFDSILCDNDVLDAVKEGIINSKDPAKSYSEFAKASTELYNRMMKQQLSSADPSAQQNTGGKKIKIGIFDSSGAVMVDIGGGD